MKQILPSYIFYLPTIAFGQQEDQFTQFMHYKLGYNPAYAGSTGGTALLPWAAAVDGILMGRHSPN